jgi:putative transposase
MRPPYETTWLTEESHHTLVRYDLGGHTHHRLDYHFVWRTKLNRKILGPTLAPFLVRQIGMICDARQIHRLGQAVAANHVHLCARLKPSQAPAEVMRWIKGATSKRVFEEYPQIQDRFGIKNLWQRGYHVETLGEKNPFAILAYIGRQDIKHELAELDHHFEAIERFLSQVDIDAGGDEEDRTEVRG